MSGLSNLYALDDFEVAARRRLPPCIFGFIEGGAETNAARDSARQSFTAWALRPRVLVDTAARSTRARLFDETFAAPFGISPMGAASLAAFECERVLAEAAAEANIPFVLSAVALMRLEEIIEANPAAWFQAYMSGDRSRMKPLLDRVARAGYRTLVVTADVPAPGNRENNARNGFALPLRPTPRLAWEGLSHPHWLCFNLMRTLMTRGMPHVENLDVGRGLPLISAHVEQGLSRRYGLVWDDIAWIRDQWRGRLVLKGVLAAEDAVAAERLAIDGIIVSSHGGRQLDGAMSPLAALPAVEQKTRDTTIMLDGGVRRGTDILKALGLGADFTFLGRPFLYAAAVGGKAGVLHAIDLLSREVDRNMAMIGCADLAHIGPELVVSSIAVRP